VSAIVSVETVLLVLLLVLVAGLLRSNAEILRRLASWEAGESTGPRIPAPGAAPVRAPGAPAAALTGPTPAGGAVSLDFAAAGGAPTLLAFLSSGCGTCAGFWEALGARPLPPAVRAVVVTHGSERERPARLRELAPPGMPVVMSSQAWRDYGVPGAPYFVLVDGAIRGEGVATTWDALISLVGDAIEDARESDPAARPSARGTARAHRVERTLAAAGIGPEHPSLYPSRSPGSPTAPTSPEDG
jgi:hypothetical protein